MRVAVVCDWFLKYATAQAAALAEAGLDAALLCRDHSYEFGKSRTERRHALAYAAERGVRIFVVRGRVWSRRGALSSLATGGEFRRWEPDLVHVHDNHDPRLLAICRGYPTVLTVHDPVPHPGAEAQTPAKRLLRLVWLRRAHRIVVHGNSLKEELLHVRPESRVAVLPHGSSVASRPLPRPASLAVGLIGRLQPYKGLPILLEAMQHIWSNGKDVRLVVAGDGPEARLLPRESRIEARIGYVPETEFDEILSSLSLVALPYVQGSQSGVGAIAISRGLPVVVSDVGALGELAAAPELVVKPGDPRDLSDALLRNLDHSDQLRWQTLEHARRTLGWEVVTRRAIELYEEVAA
jgi:alpha-maltose-1-phosphate synthase